VGVSYTLAVGLTLEWTDQIPEGLYVQLRFDYKMATGTVDFFNDTGGYGFIDTEDADEDVFFHMEDVGGPDLEEGQEVEFDIEEADKGPRATNLTRL
jgi:CspA family cold shock protein